MKKLNMKAVIIAIILLILFILGIIFVGFIKSILLLGIVLCIMYLIKKYGPKKSAKKKDVKKTDDVFSDTVKLNKRKKKSKMRLIFTIFLGIICIFTIIAIIISVLYFSKIVTNAPEFDAENLYLKEMSTIVDSSGEVKINLGTEKRKVITYDEMPQVLIDAILATEDSRFYQHKGVDVPRFAKTVLYQLMGKRDAGGASTLSMQIVKLQFTTSDVSIDRKFTDIYLAHTKLEQKYTKNEILEFYVNIPYLGSGVYGVEMAARTYFGKTTAELNVSEAATIAGLFQSPSAYDPYVNPEAAEERRLLVLKLMNYHGYITDDEYEFAKSLTVESMLVGKKSEVNEFQDYIDTVIMEVREKTGDDPYTTSMVIETALNVDRQREINEIMASHEFENTEVQVGGAVINTHNGNIEAVVAGRNREGELSYNFATDINRQPGSTAKPLYDYAPGMEFLNYSTYTPFLDEAYTYTGGTSIKNWDGKYMGLLTLRQSLGYSRNIPALKAFQAVTAEVGNQKHIEFVESLGLTPDTKEGMFEAHSIGGYTGTNPVELAGAYATFANGGYYYEPKSVLKITYRDTNEIKDFSDEGTKVMSDSTAFMISDALVWAVSGGGINSGIRQSGRQIAGKSGTSNFDDATLDAFNLPSSAVNDLWYAAYTPDTVVTLWYGYEKTSSEYYNGNGSSKARDNFYNKLLNAMFKNDATTFTKPSSVVAVQVEKGTNPAMLPSENTPSNMILTEYFKKGTEPTIVSPIYQSKKPVSNLNVKVNDTKTSAVVTWDYTTQDNYDPEIMGDVVYKVLVKNADGTKKVVYTGSEKTYTHYITGSPTSLTFIVQVTYSKYSDTVYSSAESTVSLVDTTVPALSISLSGNTNITLKIGESYIEPAYPVIVMDGTTDITSLEDVKVTKVIKKLDGTVVTAVTTTVPETFTITYTAAYKGVTASVIKTITVVESTTP